MKNYIDVFDYTKEILQGTKKGALVTTKNNGKVNTMTISWGMLGIEWNKPIFIVYVRENRFTKQQLDESLEFTINIPYGEFEKKILGYSGTTSGKDVDKVKALNLTLVESDKISAPGLKELPLTLECKVLYKQKQELLSLPKELRDQMYPQDVDASYHGANCDIHTAYYGEIVSAYIIQD